MVAYRGYHGQNPEYIEPCDCKRGLNIRGCQGTLNNLNVHWFKWGRPTAMLKDLSPDDEEQVVDPGFAATRQDATAMRAQLHYQRPMLALAGLRTSDAGFKASLRKCLERLYDLVAMLQQSLTAA